MKLLSKISVKEKKTKQKPVKNPKQAGQSLNSRLVVVGASIILSIVIMVVLFSYESILAKQGNTYSAIATQQQVLSQQIATFALDTASGTSAAFIQLKRHQSRFTETLKQLKNGDPTLDLPPVPDQLAAELSNIELFWGDYEDNIETILDSRESIETVSEYVGLINESIPELLSLSDEVVKLLVKQKASRQSIALATRQLSLIKSVQNSLNQILAGGDVVVSAADAFGRETALIERLLVAMLDGNKALGVPKLKGEEVVAKLLEVVDLFTVVKKNVSNILENSPQLFDVYDAAGNIQSISPKLLNASRDFTNSVSLFDDRLRLLNFAGYFAGIVALILLIVLGVQIVKESQQRLRESRDQNKKNQQAILRLLDEMMNLADGDLSLHTTVTEDITGAIADSVNYSIDALRELVITVNNTALQVTGAVSKSQSITSELVSASEQQTHQITEANKAISFVSEGMNTVSNDADESAKVARESVNIAHDGGETVRKTISGMEGIREQIQETSKRIKRLGESSQEIGDIVSLITEISDQTNILALNAAIQASMAGEAGRGFAVVADEVQRLAERTGDATKQIEALVKTIQADTSEAMTSMEQSTSNVVDGARLAEDAGRSLDKIESVSLNLAQRILEISEATRSQAKQSVKITENMSGIQQITKKTSEGSQESFEAIGDLSTMVKQMHKSVAGFKLPGIGLQDSTIIQNITEYASDKAAAEK